MSEPKITNIEPYESDDSQDPNYIPSQTPESEDYTSYESSSLETESESDYSIACSEDCSSFSSLEYIILYYKNNIVLVKKILKIKKNKKLKLKN